MITNKKIMELARKAKAEGVTIVQGTTFLNNTACVLGAACSRIKPNFNQFDDSMSGLLGRSKKFINGVIIGFDNCYQDKTSIRDKQTLAGFEFGELARKELL